jgi:hypothetical protein
MQNMHAQYACTICMHNMHAHASATACICHACAVRRIRMLLRGCTPLGENDIRPVGQRPEHGSHMRNAGLVALVEPELTEQLLSKLSTEAAIDQHSKSRVDVPLTLSLGNCNAEICTGECLLSARRVRCIRATKSLLSKRNVAAVHTLCTRCGPCVHAKVICSPCQ